MATRGLIGKFTGTDGPRMPMDMSTPQWLQEMQSKAAGTEWLLQIDVEKLIINCLSVYIIILAFNFK